VRGLAFAPTQSLIATISNEQVNVYNYRQASQTTQWFTFDLSIINLNGVFFSNNGNLLIVHADNMVHIWSMIDGGKVGEMRWLDGKSILTHNGEALVAVSPTGSIYKLALATVDE
jgi:WD40 repeat protein